MNFINLYEYAHRVFISCSDNFQYMALFLGAMLYVCVTEKSKLVKILTYGSLLFMVLFAFPPIVKICIWFFPEGECVNILRLLPTLMLIAYVFVKHFFELESRKNKTIWMCFCILLLLLSGKCEYFQVFSTEIAQNKYYVKDEYLEICSTIPLKKESKILVCDIELAKALRRISGESRLVYGADIEKGEYIREVKQLYNFLEQDNVPLEAVMELAIAEGTTHIILYKWKNYEDALENVLDRGELRMLGETESYWSFSITEI